METVVVNVVFAAMVSLTVTWLVGNSLTVRLERDKKTTEGDLAVQEQFYRLYGEFFSAWKAWNEACESSHVRDSYENDRTAALRTVADAEGRLEAMIVRIATSRRLSSLECDAIGAFRQGYQRLRKAINSRKRLEWDSSEHPEYLAFKGLAVKMGLILAPRVPGLAGSRPAQPSQAEAVEALRSVTSNVHEAHSTVREKVWTNVAALQELVPLDPHRGPGAPEQR